MNKWKKFTSLVLCAVLLGGALCGCKEAGEDKSGVQGGQASADAQDINSSEQEAAQDGEAAAQEQAVSDTGIDTSERITLRIMTQSYTPTMDCENMPMWQELEEQCNVDIEWEQVRSGWEEKKAVVLASNDLPDIFLGGLTDGDIVTNAEAFVDMTDLIDAYAPNVKKMLEEVPAARVSSTFDENGILSLPLICGFNPRSAATMVINKKWLDTLGLEVPTTFDELEEVLKAFKEGDPNGNGEADEIPLDWPAESHAHSIYCLTGSYGVVDNMSEEMLLLEDGKVDFLFTTEAFKNVTVYLNRLYSQGLINPEVYTNDYAAAGALSTEGDVPRVGVTVGWSIESRTGKFASEYIVLPQLKVSADDTSKVLWPCYNTDITNPNACELTTACKYPERAMMLINEMYSEDFALQSYYGSAPDNVVKHEDGTWEILVPEDGNTIEGNKWKNALVNYGPGYCSKDLESRTIIPDELKDRLEQDDVYADNRLDRSEIYPRVKFSDADTEELVYLKSDLFKLVKQKMAEWCVNGGIEQEWDQYLKELDTMGLEKMREIYQRAYEDYMALQ